jgi:hypothetical protein
MERILMLVMELKRKETTMTAKNNRLRRGKREEVIAMNGTPAAIATRNTRYFMVGLMIPCHGTSEKLNMILLLLPRRET